MARRALTVIAVLIIGACSGGSARPVSPAPGSEGATKTPDSDAAAAGSWERIRKAPVGWYPPEGAFWIKKQLVVVGGSTVQTWNPKNAKWNVIAQIPQADECEGCGYSETVVWTGRQLLLWGGGFSYRARWQSAAGASVELDGDIEPLPEAPIPVRWWHDAIWTGDEMIVFGGGRDSHARRDGAAYDPSTQAWRVLPKSPVGGYANTLVWTGTEMITWGGIEDSTGTHGYPTGFVGEGAAYDPAADSWRLLEDSELDPRGWHSAVWTGEEMIVWGGVAQPQTSCYDCGYAENAGAYNPASRTWREIDPGPLPGRVDHTAVWTGSQMIVYGGGTPGGGGGFDDGAAYDVAGDAWSLLPDAPIEGRYRHAAIWIGDGMAVWSGQKPSGSSYMDGAIFRPAS